MEKTETTNHKRIWILGSAAALVILLIIVIITTLNKDKPKVSTAEGQTIYKVKVTSTTVDDMSDWKISGTTNAPDGAKLFATYGDSTDDEDFGVNAATATSLTSWATVKNGKFTMYVDPLTLHYKSTYKPDSSIKSYLFAVTGLKGKLEKYDTESNISDHMKSSIIDTIKITKLTLNSSQADYYNNLKEPSSSSEASSESEYSSTSDSSSSYSENNDVTSYQTGITYDQIARTPNDYKGKKMQFTGKVIQVVENDSETDIRLAVDGNYDNIIMVGFDPDVLNGSRVLEDDLVTVSGESVGTLSYKSTMGGKITVPAIYAKIIDDQGKASDDYGE